MKILSLLTAAALAGGCYSESQSVHSYSAAPEATATGQVVNVTEVVNRREGHPVAGAAAGALLGGAIFHSAGAAIVGGGIGALASSGHGERRTYEVTVRFDNGEMGRFEYADWAPFRPGDRVILQGDQLARM